MINYACMILTCIPLCLQTSNTNDLMFVIPGQLLVKMISNIEKNDK